MGQYDFSYEIPLDYSNRVRQLLQQTTCDTKLAKAFQRCRFEYDDLGLAYYAGLKGDNWDKHAIDFTFEGEKSDIDILNNHLSILKDALSKGLRSSSSGLLVRNVLFFVDENATLPLSDEMRLNADIETANVVLNDLIKICERLSTNVAYNRETSENSINDYIRDALLLMGYNEIKDQTRHGISFNGKDAGEVDILISKEDREIALFEGMKLSCIDSEYIDTHISKAIVNYNALGTATFIVAYVSTADFESFWNRYTSHIDGYSFPLQIKHALEIKASPNAATRIAFMILSRDGYDFPVYYIAVNID